MYTATLHWVKGDSTDKIVMEAESLEELQKAARQEMTRRGAEEYWSSDVCKDGAPLS